MDSIVVGTISNLDFMALPNPKGHVYAKKFIIFSKSEFTSQLIPSDFADYFGSVGLSDINSQEWGAFFSFDLLPIFTEHEVEEEMKEGLFISVASAAFKHFLLSLWLIKDNAVCIKTAYAFRIENRKAVSAKNSAIDIISNSQGGNTITKFTTEEMQEAQKLIAEISTKHAAHLTNTVMELYGYDNSMEVENRIIRSFSAIVSARSRLYLPAKISMYVLALEALFSEGSEEGITHKIAERVAFYLGSTNVERRNIYETVNLAYRVRSKYVHGANPNTTKPSLEYQHTERQKLSQKIDEILRRIFRRILESDSHLFLRPTEKSNTVMENETFMYFLKSLVFPE